MGKGLWPLAVCKDDREPAMVTLALDDFLELVGEWWGRPEQGRITNDRSRGGRPRKNEGPRVPYEEVDRLLVFGEVIPCDDGSDNTQVVFPSYRQLGDRYGVSHTVIAEYAKKRNIQRRRTEAQARIQSKAEQKLIEHRATALALPKDDELRIIDRDLAGFEEALGEGRGALRQPGRLQHDGAV